MDEFVMRGQTASGGTETLNFGGHKDGYGFLLTEFQIYPSGPIALASSIELMATVTAAKTFEDPQNPNFNNEGLIASTYLTLNDNPAYGTTLGPSIVNDTFVITQDLIIAVLDAVAGAPQAVNWQCRFRPVKLDTAKQALTNYRQFQIFDE